MRIVWVYEEKNLDINGVDKNEIDVNVIDENEIDVQNGIDGKTTTYHSARC